MRRLKYDSHTRALSGRAEQGLMTFSLSPVNVSEPGDR